MKKIIKIVIAEDHSMFREGMKLQLMHIKNLAIVGEAENGQKLIEEVSFLKPDVVLTDIDMPIMNGVEATKEIGKINPAIRVIALTMYGDEHLIIDMLDAGAKGYLLKSSKKEEVLDAIEIVHEGGNYFCNNTSMKLSKMIAKRPGNELAGSVKFSEKELAVIKLICEQYGSKQIATLTNLTYYTVEKYRNNIMEKIGASNVVGIVVYAIRHGLFKP